MATDTKQNKRITKRKNPAPSTAKETPSDIEYNVDEIEEEPPAKIANPTSTIQEMKSTIQVLRQSNVEVTEKLNEFRMRIDLGEIDEYQWKKAGLQKQYAIANSILQCFETARAQILTGNQEKGIASMDSSSPKQSARKQQS